ncbi:hypothetical protein ZIOFF_035498 [Zingiber officinale]|uniref:Uncharacterized protein n=1 Tax=Zingiber officinale TaxID=94328 RepID=A0A8J5L2Q0_ZINOF|nr:hypothetical protein ZIOFF_035498 [Zingiber officinale]
MVLRCPGTHVQEAPPFHRFQLGSTWLGRLLLPPTLRYGLISPCLERVCLKRMIVFDADLALLTHSFPSFRDLMLICCDGISTPGLAVIAKLCKVLDLIKNDVEDEDEELVD